MPRFLSPIIVPEEFVTGNETISGIQTIIGATSGKDSYWTEVAIQSGLSADHGNFVGNVSALTFYGDGSHLTGISGSSGNYLPLDGGVMTGPINFGYSYGPRIDQGRYDSSRGGLSGISLVCSVDYDLNWQAGWITSLQQDRITPMPLYIDSGVGTVLRVWNGAYVGDGYGVEISHNGITFSDSSIQTTAGFPLSGGTLTAGITGTTAEFSDAVYASTATVGTSSTQLATTAFVQENLNTILSSNSSTYVTLTGSQILTNKTIVDWMTLIRGYNTTPTLCATIVTGEVYTYAYNSSPSNITYYRYIATDGSEDAFYTYFSGNTLSGLVASKSIII
jgi:hypothetical protein